MAYLRGGGLIRCWGPCHVVEGRGGGLPNIGGSERGSFGFPYRLFSMRQPVMLQGSFHIPNSIYYHLAPLAFIFWLMEQCRRHIMALITDCL